MEQENEEGGEKVIVAGYTVRPHFFSESGEPLWIPILFDTRPVGVILPLDDILVTFLFSFIFLG